MAISVFLVVSLSGYFNGCGCQLKFTAILLSASYLCHELSFCLELLQRLQDSGSCSMSTDIGTVVIQTTNSNCPCEHLENIPNYKDKLLLVCCSYASCMGIVYYCNCYAFFFLCRKEIMARQKKQRVKQLPLGSQCPTPPWGPQWNNVCYFCLISNQQNFMF